MYKRIANIFAALLIIAAVSGCSFGSGNAAYYSIAGYAEAEQARKLYASLDSGHFYTVDNATGETTEEFTFMYRSDGCLMYSRMGAVEGETYYEFHNGSEKNYRYGGDEEWSFVQQGDEDYYVYTRDDPHPYTAEGVISVNAFAITDSKVEETEGGLKITFRYDASLLAATLADVGALDSFGSILWLNEEGYCWRLDQVAVFDGGELISDYSMFIDRMNEITELTRPDSF